MSNLFQEEERNRKEEEERIKREEEERKRKEEERIRKEVWLVLLCGVEIQLRKRQVFQFTPLTFV